VFFFSPFFGGFGFPFLGYSPYQHGDRYWYPYYGRGYRRIFPYHGFGGLGYYGYGFSPYSHGNYGNYGYTTGPAVVSPQQPATTASGQFAQQGELEFKARRYKAAIQSWRHALVDDPQNGVLVLMLGQALFADGQFDEAAGAVQQGLAMLPEDQWNVVVGNYKELYGRSGEYAAQLKALEKAAKQEADNPADLFLLGYHYGFLGYPTQAVTKLDQLIKLAPEDELAKRLRGVMLGDKAPATDDRPPATAPPVPEGASATPTP
jgi:tetratricopeptide (TPR) repeat protein